MSIPSDFTLNLNNAQGAILTDEQVKSGKSIWNQLSSSEKERNDVYILIIQGLKLLSDLHAKVGDASFQKGFELLKKLEGDQLRDAHQTIARQVFYLPHHKRIDNAYKETVAALKACNKAMRNAESYAPEEAQRVMEAMGKAIQKMGTLLRHCREGIAFLEKHSEVGNKKKKINDYQTKVESLNWEWRMILDYLNTMSKDNLSEPTLPVEYEDMDQTLSMFHELIKKKLNLFAGEPEVEEPEEFEEEVLEVSHPVEKDSTRQKNLEAIASIEDVAARARLEKLLDSDTGQFLEEAKKMCPKPLFAPGGKVVVTDPMKTELNRLNRKRNDVRQNGLKSEALKGLAGELQINDEGALKAKMLEIQEKWLKTGSEGEWSYDERGKLVQVSDNWLMKVQAGYAQGNSVPLLWQGTEWEPNWMNFWGTPFAGEEEWK